MTTSWRILALAAVLGATAGPRAADAQTVFVRSVPAGETVEAVLNGKATGTATADAVGDARIPLPLSSIGKTEIDANVYVDACDKRHRILVVERGQVAPTEAGCERRDIPGIFWVRSVSTLVVNLAAANPTMLLIQGNYTPPAVSASGEAATAVPRRQAPTGLDLFGAAAYTKFSNAGSIACGDLTDCTKHDGGIGYAVGGDYWITKFLAAEAGYLRPKRATASGKGTGFAFDSSLTSDIVVVAGKIAIPAGPVRVYGTVGVDYHQATIDTTQSQDAITIAVDGVEQTIPAATQSFRMKTKGFGWLFGGGMEAWVNPSVAIYGEAKYAQVKGDAEGNVEGRIDDKLTIFVAGAKVHVGKK